MKDEDMESVESLAGAVIESWNAYTAEARPVRAAALLLEHDAAVSMLRIGIRLALTDRTAGSSAG